MLAGLKLFSLPLPVSCHGKRRQQLAELYSCKAGVFKAVLFSPPGHRLVLISGSISSIFSLCNFSGKARHHLRGKVLRQLALKVAAHDLYFSFGFVR